jgi:hypothetical protein
MDDEASAHSMLGSDSTSLTHIHPRFDQANVVNIPLSLDLLGLDNRTSGTMTTRIRKRNHPAGISENDDVDTVRVGGTHRLCAMLCIWLIKGRDWFSFRETTIPGSGFDGFPSFFFFSMYLLTTATR